MWHRGNKATVTETGVKFFYSIYYLVFPISLVGGAVSVTNRDESLFLIEAAIISSVELFKLLYIIWKKDEILDVLNRIGVYSMEEKEEFTLANDKLNRLMKFTSMFLSSAYFCGLCVVLVFPFLGSERSLFFNIAFPLDWKTNEFSYWIAFGFIFTETILTAISMLFSVIIWYLMVNCALRYEILGHQIQNMGVIKPVEGITNRRKISNLFLQDLFAAIESQKHIKEY